MTGSQRIGDKPIPADVAKILLQNAFQTYEDGHDHTRKVVVDIGEAGMYLKGSLNEYAAYLSHCGDGGTVTFSYDQLQRDERNAGLIPENQVAGTVTTEGRIDKGGKGRQT